MPWWGDLLAGFVGMALILYGPRLTVRLWEHWQRDTLTGWEVRPRNKG
jgi:hypothetical protein